MQFAILVVVNAEQSIRERFSVAAAVLNFVVGPPLVGLIHLEHVKSLRPSFIISAYFFVSMLLDIARVRTEWLLKESPAYAGLLTVSFIVKVTLLLLETIEKRRLLYADEKRISVESTSGPFSRGFFVWLNGLLRAGFRSLLALDSLPAIYEKLHSGKTHERFKEAWLKRKCIQ